MNDRPNGELTEAGATTTPGDVALAGEAGPPSGAGPEAPRRKSRAWRWWLVGLAGAIGLGVFMWAVDGRINKPAPRPQGLAATPAEAVDKFLAAVDRHDADLARAYAGETLDSYVEEWIDRAGYVRLVDAGEASSPPAEAPTPAASPGATETTGAVTLDVTYEAVTGFLDDDDPLGLNLVILVWTEQVEQPFVVIPAAGGGWVVADAGRPLRE